jgi:hypothetical protein
MVLYSHRVFPDGVMKITWTDGLMRVKPEASGSMSMEKTQGWHCLYRDYLENIEHPY